MKHFVETVMPSDEVWVAEVDSAIAACWFWRETR